MQKRTAFKLCLAGATAVALNAAPVAVFAKDEPLKVAFVYVSPANEEGWSSQHDIARKFVEEKFGDKIKVTWIENIPENADAQRVIRDTVSGLLLAVRCEVSGKSGKPELKLVAFSPTPVSQTGEFDALIGGCL